MAQNTIKASSVAEPSGLQAHLEARAAPQELNPEIARPERVYPFSLEEGTDFTSTYKEFPLERLQVLSEALGGYAMSVEALIARTPKGGSILNPQADSDVIDRYQAIVNKCHWLQDELIEVIKNLG